MPDKSASRQLDLNDPNAQQELQDAFPEHTLVICHDADGPLAMLYPKDQCIIGEPAGCGVQLLIDELSMCEPHVDLSVESDNNNVPTLKTTNYPAPPSPIMNAKRVRKTRKKPPDGQTKAQQLCDNTFQTA